MTTVSTVCSTPKKCGKMNSACCSVGITKKLRRVSHICETRIGRTGALLGGPE